MAWTTEQVKSALLYAGFVEPQLSMALAQAAYESATNGIPFSSPKAIENKNLSGILYLDKPYQKNATKSVRVNTDSKKSVANFLTLNDWAIDFKRILSLNKSIGKPIDSTELSVYNDRLQANNYYGKDSKSVYYNGLVSWNKKLGIPIDKGTAPKIGESATNVLNFTNGATSDISVQLKNDLNKAAKDTGIKKITIQYTKNGGHANNSRHFKGQAVDIQYIDDKHVGTVNWASNKPGSPAVGDQDAKRLIAALGNYGYRTTTSESGSPKAIIYLSAGHYNHIHISNNGSEPDSKSDVIAANGDSQNTTEQDIRNKDLKLNLEAIEANVAASEEDNVDVSWGMRSSYVEQSDWIGLRQFILYLVTTYYPKSLVPFIELIPIFLLDEAVPNSNQQTSNFEYQLSELERNRFNKTRNKITSLNSSNGIDLINLDPFEDAKDFKSERNFGYKIFGSVSLNPSIQGEETSKAGGIGFQSIEIQSGLAQQQGLSLITINLLDVQGNKFLDMSSPWSFILNSPQIKGDFYFRYGWQFEVPEYTDKKNNSTEYKFWNHPGWKVFGKDSNEGLVKLKKQISGKAKTAMNTLSFTQISTLDSIFYPGFTVGKDEKNNVGTFKIDRNLNTNYYWIISMINPELNVNSQDGSIIASIQFRMNNAMANCFCPLSNADETRKLVNEKKESETDLFTLMSAFLKDNKKYIEGDEKLKQYKDLYINPESKNSSDWLVVKSLSTDTRVDPKSIKIVFPNHTLNDLNNSDKSKEANLTLRAWISQVCEINYLTLVSMGDHSVQTVNNSSGFIFIFDDNAANYKMDGTSNSYVGDGYFGYNEMERLTTQDDVFSFRFKGSLIEELQIQKNDNPSAAKIEQESSAAKAGVDDVQTGGVDNNDPNKTGNKNTSNNSVTWADKKRNLHQRLSKISAATIKCIGHPWLKLAYPIYIKGMNYFDGKYIISKLKHTISNDGKFISEIDTVRVIEDNDYTKRQQFIKDSQKKSQEYGEFYNFMTSRIGLKIPSEEDIIKSFEKPSTKSNILIAKKDVSIYQFTNLQDSFNSKNK